MPTHEKGRDRDKYYQLAKDQGYRSRAAFKLIQINKRYDFLRNAKVCIDLCAAPGGWCQVAAKFMPAGSLVLGVDLLPIKALRGVKTIVGDITTASCRKDIVASLQGWKADVVLCDGAPNIGAAYAKDAFVQNELVLAALKTATEHLSRGGTFCTKVYRSVDSHALVWAIQQLFTDVQTMKPNSSRSQSSEIFLIAQGYLAPQKVDPQLFDPNVVFKEVDEGLSASAKGPDVLHKKYDVQKRHRSGYDASLGMTLHANRSVKDFILSSDPVRMLTDVHSLSFGPDDECYKTHPKTSPETIIACSDLQVLGKIDFKKLLKWRDFMKDAFHKVDEPVVEKKSKDEDAEERDPEADLDAELARLQHDALAQRRRDDKKARTLAAKERARQALGMSHNVFSEDVDAELFSLALAKQEPAAQKNKKRSAEEVEDAEEDEEDEEVLAQAMLAHRESEERSDEDEEQREARLRQTVGSRSAFFAKNRTAEEVEDEEELSATEAARAAEEEELAGDYAHFLAARRGKKRERGARESEVDAERTFSSKRAARERDALPDTVDDSLSGDDEVNDKASQRVSERERRELEEYVRLLEKQRESDESEDESERDSDAAEGANASGGGKWFENELFSTLSARPAKTSSSRSASLSLSSSKSKRESERENAVVAELGMPRTAKEVRATKRQRNAERSARKEERNAALLVEDEDKRDGEKDMPREALSKSRGANDFEIVPQSTLSLDDAPPVARHDSRTYDSDEEHYDLTDRAHTMALGTLFLRNSRQKAYVDAAYNRYAWNDPMGLPAWFKDDEMRHNRPVLPVPQALVEQIKAKHQLTGTRVIKKVAEARARKRKRAADKLKNAKKQAAVFAENSELSERQKLKAISKALRNTKKSESSSKVYVATRKTQSGSVGTSKGARGKGSQLKFVDSRMKKDRRAMRVLEKKNKKRKK